MQYLPLESVSSLVQNCKINSSILLLIVVVVYMMLTLQSMGFLSPTTWNVFKLWYVLELYKYYNVPVLGENTKCN